MQFVVLMSIKILVIKICYLTLKARFTLLVTFRDVLLRRLFGALMSPRSDLAGTYLTPSFGYVSTLVL